MVTRLIDKGLFPARRCWVKNLSSIHVVLSSLNASLLDILLAYSWNKWDQRFLVSPVGYFFFMFYWVKLFLVGLVDQLFQPAWNQVETVRRKNIYVIMSRDCSSCKDYSRRFNRKRLAEKCIEKRHSCQSTQNSNRLRLKRLVTIKHDLSVFFVLPCFIYFFTLSFRVK